MAGDVSFDTIVAEILRAEEFFKNPLALEYQVWNESTADAFRAKGYAVMEGNDGSFWITDESRYLD